MSQSVVQVAQDEQEKRDVFPFVGVGTVVVRVGSDKSGELQISARTEPNDARLGHRKNVVHDCIGQWGILSLLIDT